MLSLLVKAALLFMYDPPGVSHEWGSYSLPFLLSAHKLAIWRYLQEAHVQISTSFFMFGRVLNMWPWLVIRGDWERSIKKAYQVTYWLISLAHFQLSNRHSCGKTRVVVVTFRLIYLRMVDLWQSSLTWLKEGPC